MIAWEPTKSPPAPTPWRARNPISSTMFWESPQSMDPTRKMTIAPWKMRLRPYRSPIFPYSGVEIVEVRM